MRRALATAAALLLLGLSACGSHSSSSDLPSAEAAKPAEEIFADAAAALREVHSFRIVVDGEGETGRLHLEAAIRDPKTLRGRMTLGETTFDFIAVGGSFYIRGQDFIARQAGAQAAAAIGDRWVASHDDSALTAFRSFTDPQLLASRFTGESHGKLSKEGLSNVDGVRAVKLVENGRDALYVAADGEPFPVRLEVRSGCSTGAGQDSCTVDFEAINQPVDISAPSNVYSEP